MPVGVLAQSAAAAAAAGLASPEPPLSPPESRRSRPKPPAAPPAPSSTRPDPARASLRHATKHKLTAWLFASTMASPSFAEVHLETALLVRSLVSLQSEAESSQPQLENRLDWLVMLYASAWIFVLNWCGPSILLITTFAAHARPDDGTGLFERPLSNRSANS
eukprot:SAG31_NODE_363_length_16899_cov_9.812976_5_plen_163_part_00